MNYHELWKYKYKQNCYIELLSNEELEVRKMIFEHEYSLLSYKIIRFRDSKKIDNDILAVELYNFFLSLRKLYLENQLSGSLALRNAFHGIMYHHKLEIHNAMNTIENKDENGYSLLERELEKIEDIVNEDIYQLLKGKPVQYFYKTSFKNRIIYGNED